MYDLILHNAKIYACNEDYTIIDNGFIAINDGKIIEVSSGSIEGIKANDYIDAGGKLVTPGLIDCHTHTVYAGDRSGEFEQRLAGVSYEEILQKGGGILSTVKSTREAGFEELQEVSLQRINSMFKQGTTSVEIKSGYGLDKDSEIKILRVAKSLKEKSAISIYPTFLGAHTTAPEYKGDSDGYIDYLIKELLPYIAKEDLAIFVDAYSETIGFSTEQIERLFNAATEHGFKLKLHAEQLSNQGGALLAGRRGAVSVDHLEYLPKSDCINLYRANKNTVAVILPGAFYFLKETQKPPIQSLRKAGVKMAIATDCNPGTSPFLSLPLMMNMACVLFGFTIEEAFKAVTINAARALDADSKIGSLEIGKNADIVVWNASDVSSIIYNSTQNFCNIIIKDGKICIE